MADALSRKFEATEPVFLAFSSPVLNFVDQLRGFYTSHREACELQEALLKEFLSTPFSGHSGTRATMARLAASFYWPAMQKDVKHMVAHCEI